MQTTNEIKSRKERVIQNNRSGHRNQVRVSPGFANWSATDVASLGVVREGSRGAVHALCVPLGAEDLRRLGQNCLELADEMDALRGSGEEPVKNSASPSSLAAPGEAAYGSQLAGC
jgi:hypothetical protein